MRAKRIIAGILIGGAIGVGLEGGNTFLAFFMPPFLFLSSSALLGGCIGALAKVPQGAGSHRTPPDFGRLPACGVDFLTQLTKKMRYRHKVRQEVQSELAVHFEDNLKDCLTEGQREQKAEKLITDFGDLKVLAILLRRAKKRCRPLWRTVCARTFQATGVLILCFVAYVVWFFSGKPAIRTDYVAELNRIVTPGADESLNAAPFYDRAAKLHGRLSNDFLIYFAQNHQMLADTENPSSARRLPKTAEIASEVLRFQNWDPPHKDIQRRVYKTVSAFLTKIGYKELTADQLNLVDKWVQEHNDALEFVVEGARLPHCWREYTSTGQMPVWMIENQLPRSPVSRELCRALRWRALRRAEQGRHKDAFDDVTTLYRFGLHMRTDKLLFEQLVGIALQAIAVQTARDMVGSYQINSQVLEDFQRDLERIIADEDFSISFTADKLWLYDEIQKCFTSGRIGKGHLYLPRFREISHLYGNYTPASGVESIVMNLGEYGPYLFTHPNKEETLETTNALYDYYDQLVSMTAVQRHAEIAAIESKLRAFVKGNKLLNASSPAILRIIDISNRLPMDVSATLAILAISRYKTDKGNYPQDLSQLLAEGYLTKLPIDTFADKPLVYKRTDDSFILYSVGPNFKDDGGTPGKDSKGRPKQWTDNGDTFFWPLPESQVKSQQ